jgi:hypothetical protein
VIHLVEVRKFVAQVAQDRIASPETTIASPAKYWPGELIKKSPDAHLTPRCVRYRHETKKRDASMIAICDRSISSVFSESLWPILMRLNCFGGVPPGIRLFAKAPIDTTDQG